MTRVALMQPTFLPWLGYFALADAVDLFVFLDDFQFGRRTFGQRNRLFVAGDRVDWVSVPVAHAGDAGRVTYREARPLTEAELAAVVAGVEHLRVVFVAPPSTLRLGGALGPLQGSGLSGSLTRLAQRPEPRALFADNAVKLIDGKTPFGAVAFV